MALTQETARQALTHIRNGSLKDLEMVLRGFVDGDFNALAGVTASAAELNKLDGAGAVVASGTTATNFDSVAVTYTTGDPTITPDGAVTIADGATPTVDELLEFCVEINAKVDTIIAALEAFNISADS